MLGKVKDLIASASTSFPEIEEKKSIKKALQNFTNEISNFKANKIASTLKEIKLLLVDCFAPKLLPKEIGIKLYEIRKLVTAQEQDVLASLSEPEIKEEFQQALMENRLNQDLIQRALSHVDTPLSNGQLPIHYAINFCRPAITDLLLEHADLQKKDQDGCNAFDHATLAYKNDLAERIMEKNIQKENDSIKSSCANVKKMEELAKADLLESVNSIEKFRLFTKFYGRGFEENNPLLVRAIENLDFKEFIRFCMDGADISTVNRNGETLLHLAAKAGQVEVVAYLRAFITPGSQVLTEAIEIAKKHHKTEVVDFIEWAQGKKPRSPDLDKKFNDVDRRIKDFENLYKAEQDKTEQASYSKEKKQQKFNIAKHGSTGEGLSAIVGLGHNEIVLACIVQRDLKNLIKATELGASLQTTSISKEKALEDPFSLQTKLSKKFQGEPGEDELQGKSLLDIAVLAAKEGQDNIEIIAYLLSQGLDPMKINDEGESPFSLALISGNFKAACLMMNHKNFLKGTDLALNKDIVHFDEALKLLKKGSELRDPLHVSSYKTTEGLFATAYLLTQTYLSGGMLTFMHILPILISGFFPESEPTLAEKLTHRPLPPIPFSATLQKISPTLVKGAILEMAVVPGSQVATLSTTALRVYVKAISTFSAMKTAVRHVAARPFKAAYRAGIEAISMVADVLRLKSIFGTMFAAPSKESLVCEELSPENIEKYKKETPLDRVSHEELNPECPEHAKVILAGKWDKDSIKHEYKKLSLQLHPDMHPNITQDQKKIYDAAFAKLGVAKTTLEKSISGPKPSQESTPTDGTQASDETPSFASKFSTVLSGPVASTAAKVGIIWATQRLSNMFWSGLQWGSIAYSLIFRR